MDPTVITSTWLLTLLVFLYSSLLSRSWLIVRLIGSYILASLTFPISAALWVIPYGPTVICILSLIILIQLVRRKPLKNNYLLSATLLFVLNLVPIMALIAYIGCPNCDVVRLSIRGHMDESIFAWYFLGIALSYVKPLTKLIRSQSSK